MVSPRTRTRLLQEWHDAQERGGDASAEVADLQEQMEGYGEEELKQADIVVARGAEIVAIDAKVSASSCSDS